MYRVCSYYQSIMPDRIPTESRKPEREIKKQINENERNMPRRGVSGNKGGSGKKRNKGGSGKEGNKGGSGKEGNIGSKGGSGKEGNIGNL